MKKVVSPDEHLFTGRVEFQGYVKFGTVRVIIDELGRVGIGTLVPISRLHLASDKNQSFSMSRANGTLAWQIFRDASVGTDIFRALLVDDTTWHNYITMGEGNATHAASPIVMQEQGGHVGIGVAIPTLSLDVKGKSGHSALGGFCVKLTNKTGGSTVKGQLVNVYTATAINDAFKTISANDENIIGIVLEAGVADASEAWVVVNGIADVLMDTGGSARGDRIISSVTAGSADVWNVGGAVATHFQEIGHCIETRTGAGLARCILHFN